MAEHRGDDAAKDPKFRGLLVLLARLWGVRFRGRVTVDMDGKGSIWFRCEPAPVQITGETVPRIVHLTNE